MWGWIKSVPVVMGAICGLAIDMLRQGTDKAEDIIKFVLGGCGVFMILEALTGAPHVPRKQLAPPANPDPPGQHAPAPGSNQTPKEGQKGGKKAPKTSVKPAGRGQEGFIVLNNGTIIYYERKQRQTKRLKSKEIQKPQIDIVDAEYAEYCQDFNLIDS